MGRLATTAEDEHAEVTLSRVVLKVTAGRAPVQKPDPTTLSVWVV
jgi:hypothetical protein